MDTLLRNSIGSHRTSARCHRQLSVWSDGLPDGFQHMACQVVGGGGSKASSARGACPVVLLHGPGGHARHDVAGALAPDGRPSTWHAMCYGSGRSRWQRQGAEPWSVKDWTMKNLWNVLLLSVLLAAFSVTASADPPPSDRPPSDPPPTEPVPAPPDPDDEPMPDYAPEPDDDPVEPADEPDDEPEDD